MVDNVNPVSQFHPYQPQNATPHSDETSNRAAGSGLSGMLKRAGIDRSKIDALGARMGNFDVRGQMSKARGLARNNPGLVLGGLAALAIGAGLMRRHSMTTTTR
jgi:hypothetical protein